MVSVLLSLLDGWIGDTIASRKELKFSKPHAAVLAGSGVELSVALLRNHISDPEKVKILRRFLASMLPSEHLDCELSFLCSLCILLQSVTPTSL